MEGDYDADGDSRADVSGGRLYVAATQDGRRRVFRSGPRKRSNGARGIACRGVSDQGEVVVKERLEERAFRQWDRRSHSRPGMLNELDRAAVDEKRVQNKR